MPVVNNPGQQIVTWNGQAAGNNIVLVASPGAAARLKIYGFQLGVQAASAAARLTLSWGAIANGNIITDIAIAGVATAPPVLIGFAGPLDTPLHLSIATLSGTPTGIGWVRYEIA